MAAEHQAALDRLLSLTLRGLPMTSTSALAPLGQLTQLRALRIEDSTGLPTEALGELQGLSRLHLLSLNGCSAIDNPAVGYMAPMTELHALHLDRTRCADIAVLIASAMPRLVRLHMNATQVCAFCPRNRMPPCRTLPCGTPCLQPGASKPAILPPRAALHR